MAAYKQSIEEQVENHCKEQLRTIKTYTKTTILWKPISTPSKRSASPVLNAT